jgi:hypothetical protein
MTVLVPTIQIFGLFGFDDVDARHKADMSDAQVVLPTMRDTAAATAPLARHC